MDSMREYFDELSNHDWYYQHIDDRKRYDSERETHIKLIRKSKESDIFKKMFDDFNAYFSMSGDKPELKNYEVTK